MPGIADILFLGATREAAKVQCIFLHGRSQSPEEMEAAVIRRLSALPARYVLPRAGEAHWYKARAIDPLDAATRQELEQSLADLAELIGQMRHEAQDQPILLAGFSQGACLALEMAFSGRAAPDAVVALTGCRVGTAGCDRADALPGELPVYLSGGSDDPWIPVSAFAEAAAALGQGRAALRADLFPHRAHEVSQPEIAMLEDVLMDLASGQRPRMEGAR